MTKTLAIFAIVKDARRESGWSRSSMLRVQKALRALALDADEIATCMRGFDYWDATNTPYPAYRTAKEAA